MILVILFLKFVEWNTFFYKKKKIKLSLTKSIHKIKFKTDVNFKEGFNKYY